jgi:hypothetical protein
MKHPSQEVWGFGQVPTGVLSAPDAANAIETYTVMVGLTIEDITTRNLERTKVVHLMLEGGYALYHHDPDNTELPDGINVVWDTEGRPFVKRGGITRSAAGWRNKIINGNFEFWQRGTSFTASGYTADRWKLTLGSGAALTLTRQLFALGQTDVPGNDKFYCRMVRGTAGSAPSTLEQRIESVRTLAGREITFVFWAKASAATTLVSKFTQNFGTGGSPSSAVDSATQNNALTTSWQKFSHRVTLASIAGKTLGSNDNDYLKAHFSWSESSNPTGTVEIARVCYVEGDATAESDPFPAYFISDEEVRCRRYYAKIKDAGFKGVVAVLGINIFRMSIPSPVPMKFPPALSFQGTIGVFDGYGVATLASIGANYSSIYTWEADMVSSGGLTTPNMASFYQGPGGFLIAEAEL